jgi:hypothetical protein
MQFQSIELSTMGNVAPSIIVGSPFTSNPTSDVSGFSVPSRHNFLGL